MSKPRKGLTALDRDVEDPIRRPRPVSQEGYHYPGYPGEHTDDKNSLHPNYRRQPMRQYGSSASLEVRHEQNRQQREQEFFSSPSSSPNQASFKTSQNTSAIQLNFRSTDSPTSPAYQNFGNNRNLSPRNNIKSREIPPNSNRPSNSSNLHGINTHYTHPNANKPPYHSNSPVFLTPQPNNSRASPSRHQMPPPNYYPNSAPMQQPVRKNSYGSFTQNQRPSQDSLTDPLVSPSSSSRGLEQDQILQRQISSGYSDPPQQHNYSSKDQNKAAPIIESQRLNLPEPVSIEDYISQAIKYHEDNQLAKSTDYLRIAAEKGSAVGMVLYGIALRHGWGCKANAALAFKYLHQAAESAINILNGISKTVSMSSFKGELVLAIYELGVCFRHGWGVPKSKGTAAYYFEIAANLGDPDAQNDIALCYYKGEGVRKDMKTAAKYYRLADAQGHGTMGNSWIFKEKYNDDKK